MSTANTKGGRPVAPHSRPGASAGAGHAQSRGPFLSSPPVPAGQRALFAAGTDLGRFRIEEHVGSGGLGDVYRAHDCVRDETVAIKLVEIDPTDPQVLAAELKREKDIYNQIRDCRYVVRPHDIHLAAYGGMQFLLLSMEYIAGGSFRDLLRARAGDWAARRTEGQAIFRLIVRAVMLCHEQGVVHKDLKPENILLDRSGPKLCDFNISGFVHNITGGRLPACGRTTTGVRRGTPGYMSPEQRDAAHPDDVDHRTDIYALGAIYHEILDPQGRLPRDGTLVSLQGASAAQVRIITRCLQKDPAKRFQRVGEILDALDAAEQMGTLSVPVKERWQQALAAVEQGRFGDAERVCAEILLGFPNHVDAQAILRDLQLRKSQAGQLYAAIRESIGRRGLSELAELLVSAVDHYPDHMDGLAIQVELGAMAQEYLHAMSQGAAALLRDDWEFAERCFGRAKNLDPGSFPAEAEHLRAQDVLARWRQGRQAIDKAMVDGHFEAALALAQDVDTFLATVRRDVRYLARGHERNGGR